MRITIIRDDGVVGIGSTFRKVAFTNFPAGVRVVQWETETEKGHLEHDDDDVPNTEINSIAEYQPYIDLWTAAAPPKPPAPTAAQLKAAAHDRINAMYEATISSLTAGYPENEIASWPKQEAEARAWLADSSAPTPWMSAAAYTRGIPVVTMRGLILEKANAFASVHGQLTGKRQRLRDEIDALVNPTQEQLDAIQW